jgi:hypothetical protein
MHNVNWQIMSIHLNNRPVAVNFKPMSIHSPHWTAARSQRTAAKAMVAVLAGPEARLVATPAELPRWRALTPLALWSTVSVRDTSPDGVFHGVTAELARRHVEPPRLILLAEGKAARSSLELVLQGALDCAGILAIAVPCAALPFRIIPTATAIRLVVHGGCNDAPLDLITALRGADIDARITRLDPVAAGDARPTANAAETFLFELVANASRQSRHGV